MGNVVIADGGERNAINGVQNDAINIIQSLQTLTAASMRWTKKVCAVMLRRLTNMVNAAQVSCLTVNVALKVIEGIVMEKP